MNVRILRLSGVVTGVLILGLLPAVLLAQALAPQANGVSSPSGHSEAPEAFPWQANQSDHGNLDRFQRRAGCHVTRHSTMITLGEGLTRRKP